MASLAQLMDSPVLSSLLSYVARPRSDPQVERVALIEDLADLGSVGERSIVLLTSRASAESGSYLFDIGLRTARGRDVAAVVLAPCDVGALTPTAAAIADRSGIAILGMLTEIDLAELAVAIRRVLLGEADVALIRAHAALRAIEAHPTGGTPERLIERAGAALGVPLSVVEVEPASGPRSPIKLNDHVEGWVTAPSQEGGLGMAVDLVLSAAAAATRHALAEAVRAEELPIQSRAEVLSELLSAPPHGRAPLVQRARDLGVTIDGWHVAVRLDFEDLADTDGSEQLAAYEARLGLTRAALHAVRAAGGVWHSAHAGAAVLLLRTYAEDPGATAAGEVASSVDEVLLAERSRLPATLIHCGVGSPHPGPAGLLSSAAEAKAAVTAARTSRTPYTAVPFDRVGLRRALVEWYASAVAQDAVESVLAPLTELGGARAERMIKTLHVYLDQRGSLTKTAEQLSLHRNAVAYRVNQIFERLEVDQANPDDLLLLQLACRAHELR